MNRKQRYRFLNRAGVIVGAIVLVVYGIEAAVAVANGQIIVGFNYWNAPLFALLQLIVVLVLVPFLMRYAWRHWNDDGPPPPTNE